MASPTSQIRPQHLPQPSVPPTTTATHDPAAAARTDLPARVAGAVAAVAATLHSWARPDLADQLLRSVTCGAGQPG